MPRRQAEKCYMVRADQAGNRFLLFLPHARLVIGAFTMFTQVKAFALDFFCDAKSERDFDEVESNGRTDSCPCDSDKHCLNLNTTTWTPKA